MRFRSSAMNERGISADLFSLAPFRGEKATRSVRKGVLSRCFRLRVTSHCTARRTPIRSTNVDFRERDEDPDTSPR